MMTPDLSILFFFIVLLVYLTQHVVHSSIASFESNESMDITGDYFVESVIYVSGLNDTLSLNANITLQIWLPHTWSDDLIISLYGPDESEVVLSYLQGGSKDNVFNGTLFTDSANDSVSTYTYSNNVVASPLRPEDPLSNFRGKNPNGQWKLRVIDTYPSEDDGTLKSFILNIEGN